MASLSGDFNPQFFTDTGALASGYRLYTYSPGTTTKKTVYTDAAAAFPHTYTSDGLGGEYIALNARGELPSPLFLATGGYDFTLKTTANVTVWTRKAAGIGDASASADATIRADLAEDADETKGAGLINFDPQTAYVAPSLGWMLQQSEWSVMWFDAVRTAVAAGTDCTSAVQAVYDLMLTAGRRSLFFPAHSNGYVFSGGAASADGYKNGLLCRFTAVNFDANETVVLRGEGGTIWKCNSNSMILLRIARNNVTVRDISLQSNGKTSVILCGIVPEDMTQTTTQVSQSMVLLDNVNRDGGPSVDGIVIQPGPTVGGSDSGCFYHVISAGVSNFVSGGRHVYLKKNADWSTNPNRPTRTIFRDQRLLRGNTGYYLEVGSEIELHGCNEELIANAVTPLATPTARWVSGDCTNITFFGGYSEACSLAVNAVANGIIRSFGYIPASGSDSTWVSNVSAWADETTESRDFTPALSASGGGTQGAGTVVGKATKQGKTVTVTVQVSLAPGTLSGNLSVSGIPFVASSSWGSQNLEVTSWSGITLGANYVKVNALISGGSITLQRQHGQGAAATALTVADCSNPIVFTIQGTYEAA